LGLYSNGITTFFVPTHLAIKDLKKNLKGFAAFRANNTLRRFEGFKKNGKPSLGTNEGFFDGCSQDLIDIGRL
jgi:hypothetical protein